MHRIYPAHFLVALVCHALLAGNAPAADWAVPRGPSREPVPYVYDPGVWKKVPQAFLDDAQACTLYAGMNHFVEKDGTIETVTHEITRLSSRKALEKLGEYRSITWTPAYEKVTLNEARVLKADGSTVPVEPRHVQVRDVGTDFQVYDSGKMLIISFPSLEVGDAIEVKWTVRGRNPEHAGHFFTRYNFGDDRYPLVCDELRVRLPKDRKLTHASSGGKLEPAVTEDGDTRTWHWKVAHRPPLPQDDHLPPKEELRQQVMCSTFASWDEVYKWKQHLRKDCWQCTDPIRQIVRDVTRDLKTPQEKARALTYWVRRHVRYLSAGDKHDYTPHTPAQILASRYGDCKDTSQLLAVMLKEAGIDVALVTLGVQGDGQVLEEVPSPWGTHAILLATIDGKRHWIDTTASLAGWDFLPEDDCDRLCYVTDDKGLRLLRTPALTPETNRIEQHTRLSIGADGATRAVRTSTYTGLYAYNRRHDYVEVPTGERRQQIAAELQDANSQTRLDHFSFDETALKDYDRPVQARFVFEVPGHFSGDTEKEGSITDSPVWGKLLSVTFDHHRTVPLDLGVPFESVHRYTIELPPALRHSAQARERVVQSKWGTFTMKVAVDDKTIEVSYRTRLEKVRVEPKDFDEFREFHQSISNKYRYWLTVKPTRNLADAPALEALCQLAPGDGAMAAALAELYLAKDKHDDARRVVTRARAYHPNDAALAELAVKSAGGAKEEETAYRELVRRFPDQPKYAIALGRSLLDAGSHAEARTVLQPIVKNAPAPEKAAALFQLARSAFLQGKAKDALAHLSSAADADEDSVHTVPVLVFKGQVHEKLGQFREALTAFRTAHEVDANAAEPLDGMVRSALAAKDDAAALDALRRYGVAVGQSPTGLARVADYHLRLGRLDDAAEIATRAVEEGSKSAARRTLGLVAYQRGQFAEAVNQLDQVDADAAVLEALIRGHLALGKFPSAVRHAERGVKLPQPTPELLAACKQTVQLAQRRKEVLANAKVPAGQQDAWEEAAARLACAELAYQEGRPAKLVEELCAAGCADDLQLGEALALRGLLAVDKGRLLRAAADAERALTLAPREPRGHLVRGRVRLERGDKEAVADLQRAVELTGRKDGVVLHWLAAALHRTGKVEDALQTQREAVKLRPGDPELAEQLRELEKTSKN